MGLNSNGWVPAIPTNFRLGWKSLTVANTLAYYDMAIDIVVKGFIVQAQGEREYIIKNCLYFFVATVANKCGATVS
jgi:hypothetical protein